MNCMVPKFKFSYLHSLKPYCDLTINNYNWTIKINNKSFWTFMIQAIINFFTFYCSQIEFEKNICMGFSLMVMVGFGLPKPQHDSNKKFVKILKSKSYS